MSIQYDGKHQICFWKKTYINSSFVVGDRYEIGLPKFTWDDFHLVPLERPHVNQSEPQYSLVSIPNSSKRLNITNYLPGGLTYQSRTGEWTFVIDHDQWGDWIVSHHELETYFNGSKMLVALNDDPSKIYEGRITLKDYDPGDDYSTVKIAYDLDPDNLPSTALAGVLFRVRFLDRRNNVLQGMLVPYDHAPYYAGEDPDSDGLDFQNWTPTPTGVTGNVDYTPTYVADWVIPVRIEVVTPPNKTTYSDGERIDYTGMVVKAFTSSGAVWTDKNHPDGIIPHNELIFFGFQGQRVITEQLKEAILQEKSAYIEFYRPALTRVEEDFLPTPSCDLDFNARWSYVGTLGTVGDYPFYRVNRSTRIYLNNYDSNQGNQAFAVYYGDTLYHNGSLAAYINLILASSNDKVTYNIVQELTIERTKVSEDPTPKSLPEYVHMDDIVNDSPPTSLRFNAEFIGKTVYYREVYTGLHSSATSATMYGVRLEGISGGKYVPGLEWNNIGAVTLEILAWIMVYGAKFIPIAWERPNDKKRLHAGFAITEEN